MNIVRGKVVEDTWLNITFVVYMEVFPAPGDASASQRAIVPEVNGQYRLCLPVMPYGDPELFALFRRRHQARVRVSPHRHIEKHPAIEGALLNKQVNPFLGAENVNIVTSYQGGKTKETTCLTQVIHSLHRLVKRALDT